jgi:hypothetical protein
MATQYLRITKLHDVRGRIDYISNPERQENLLAYRSTMDNKMWLALANQNQRSFKSNSRGVSANGKCIEAREIIFHLPHRYSADPEHVLNQIVDDWKNTYHTDCAAALHWNHDKTNLHIHLIFSERERLDRDKIKYATRNMYYDADWKRCNKTDAVHVIHKGAPTSPPFENAKTRSFKSYTWLEQELKAHYAKILGLDRFERDGLHIPQQKTFKYQNREKAERIRENNQIIREFNKTVDDALSKHVLEDDLRTIVEPLKDSVSRNKKNRTNALKNALNELRRGVRQLTMTLEDIWNMIKEPYHTYTVTKQKIEPCKEKLDQQKEKLNQTSVFSFKKEERHLRKETKKRIHDLEQELDGFCQKRDKAKSVIDSVLSEFPKIKPFYEYCKTVLDVWKKDEPQVYRFKDIKNSKMFYDLGVVDPEKNLMMTKYKYGDEGLDDVDLNRLVRYSEKDEVVVGSAWKLYKSGSLWKIDEEIYQKLEPIVLSTDIYDENGKYIETGNLFGELQVYEDKKVNAELNRVFESRKPKKESVHDMMKTMSQTKQKNRDIQRNIQRPKRNKDIDLER